MIDIIARGMIEESNGDISQLSEKVNNHTEDSDIHVTMRDKENWNSHPNDLQAEGNPVQMDNLQGGVPFSKMMVSGKNLIGVAQAKGLTGDNTNGYAVFDNASARSFIQKLNPNTTYCIKKYDSGNRFRIVLFNNEPTSAADKTAKQLIYNSDGSVSEYTFTTETEYLWIAITTHYATSGDAVEPIVQLEYGNTPTAYEPPITGRELTLAVSGKNLINNIQATGTVVGVTVTKNDDGTVTINGTTTGDLWLLFDDKCRVVKDKTYTFSMGFDASVGIMFGVRSGDNAQSYLSTGTSGSFVAPETGICRIRGYVKSGITFDNLTIYPQLEIGSTATPYEPYNGSVTTITPTSNPYIIPNDIRQVDGLNNISVSAGEISVTGVRKNAAIKRIWDKLDELTTAIIVSGGETE